MPIIKLKIVKYINRLFYFIVCSASFSEALLRIAQLKKLYVISLKFNRYTHSNYLVRGVKNISWRVLFKYLFS